MRLFFERSVDRAPDTSALDFRSEIEEPDFAAAMQKPDAVHNSSIFGNHTEVIRIGNPGTKIFRSLVGKPRGQCGSIVTMIGRAKHLNRAAHDLHRRVSIFGGCSTD